MRFEIFKENGNKFELFAILEFQKVDDCIYDHLKNLLTSLAASYNKAFYWTDGERKLYFL